MSRHSWSLDGRWARGSPTASHLLMHCGAASWAETGSITLQSVCTHSIHTCPGLHQKAGFQCLLDRSMRKRLGRAQPTRDHRGSSGHWMRVGKWRQNGDWGTKNFRAGGWEPTPGVAGGGTLQELKHSSDSLQASGECPMARKHFPQKT